MHLDETKVFVDRMADGHLRIFFGFRFRSGDEPLANRLELDTFPPGVIYRVLTRGRLAASLTALIPLDVVGAFAVNFDSAVDAHLVFQAPVRLRHNGREAPCSANFDLLDEIDAVAVFGSVLAVQSRHDVLLSGPITLSEWTPNWTPRR